MKYNQKHEWIKTDIDELEGSGIYDYSERVCKLCGSRHVIYDPPRYDGINGIYYSDPTEYYLNHAGVYRRNMPFCIRTQTGE